MQLLNEKCGLERKCADLRVVCFFGFFFFFDGKYSSLGYGFD